MSTRTVILVSALGGGIAGAIITAVVLADSEPPAPPAKYEVVKTCKPPFMRRTKEQVLKREDGQLFLQSYNGRMTPVADGTKLKDICR